MIKKLCFITTVSGTLKSFVLPFAEYIHEHTDYDITFICNNDDEFANLLPEYIHFIPVAMKRGISIGGVVAMFKMIRIFHREKFDMVQYSTPNASLYAALAGAIARIPIRLYCQWGIAYVGFVGIKRKIFKFIEKTVCKLSTKIEPDSLGNLHFANDEKLYHITKSSVMGHGSACGIKTSKFDITQKEKWRYLTRAKYDLPDEAIVFGFVGRITRDKGINELFAAFRDILSDIHNAYLMVVGNAEITSAVNAELYSWAQSEPHVIFCGPTNFVEQYLSAMDIYILPSYREGFGMVVIEAETMGVPVIVTDIPGPTDAVIPNKTGLVVKKADVESLKNAMKVLAESPQKRTEFGLSAHEFAVSNFEQQELFKIMLDDRKQLLGEE